MTCYRVEEILPDDESARRMPLPIWIWADVVKHEQGQSPRVLFMMIDQRMVAELHGVFSIREDRRGTVSP